MPTSESPGWWAFPISRLKLIKQQQARNAHPTNRLCLYPSSVCRLLPLLPFYVSSVCPLPSALCLPNAVLCLANIDPLAQVTIFLSIGVGVKVIL